MSAIGASALELPSDWLPSLRPASWRGIPFVVEGGAIEGGRRGPDHQYPFRDKPYPEDLGREKEMLPVVGFIVGANLIARRNTLLQALRTKGPGELAHPTLGRIQVQLRKFRISESKEYGGCFRLDFSFVEAGVAVYPATATDTQAGTKAAAATAQAAASGDFLSRVSSEISSAYNSAKAAVAPVTAFASQAMSVVNRATSAYRLVTGLQASVGSSFGRFAGITSPLQAFQAASSSLSSMESQASQLRQAASSTVTGVESLAGKLGL